MEIGNERTDVAQAVGMSAILPVLFQMLDVPPRAGVPEMHVPFVDAVNLSARRRANIFMGKKKLANTWNERKSTNAVSGGVNHHPARAVDKIAPRDLVRALLQAVFKRAVFVVFGDFVMDGKDCSNTGIDIDIGRSVQGIEHQNVFAPPVLTGSIARGGTISSRPQPEVAEQSTYLAQRPVAASIFSATTGKVVLVASDVAAEVFRVGPRLPQSQQNCHRLSFIVQKTPTIKTFWSWPSDIVYSR